MPARLSTFDLSREVTGANQKRFPLCDLGVSAVSEINFMLSLIKLRAFNPVLPAKKPQILFSLCINFR
jgi:hypothetical protein